MPRLPTARALSASVALLLGGAALAVVGAGGCSYGASSDASAPVPPWDTGGSPDAQIIEVGGDDGGTQHDRCGIRRCEPDRTDICTTVQSDAGADGDAIVEDAPKLLACRVIREGGDIVSSCAPAGDVGDSAACASDDDCKPGLACVGDPGQCLPYCCGATSGADPCDKSRYCAMLAVAARPDDRVPVCAPLETCRLLEEDRCLSGSACTVVRNDGALSCVPIGAGRDLQACPCDRGYVCLGPEGNRLCRKLCHVGDTAACGAGTCQALSTIPTGFGICTVADAGI